MTGLSKKIMESVLDIQRNSCYSTNGKQAFSRQTIGSLENGRYNPSILLAFKLSRYFGVPIEEIFIYEEEPS